MSIIWLQIPEQTGCTGEQGIHKKQYTPLICFYIYKTNNKAMSACMHKWSDRLDMRSNNSWRGDKPSRNKDNFAVCAE